MKIERRLENGKTTICLFGRLQMEHLTELGRVLQETGVATVLDLQEVTLVDVEVVRFLQACEERGIVIERCALYIREWMLRERPR